MKSARMVLDKEDSSGLECETPAVLRDLAYTGGVRNICTRVQSAQESLTFYARSCTPCAFQMNTKRNLRTFDGAKRMSRKHGSNQIVSAVIDHMSQPGCEASASERASA